MHLKISVITMNRDRMIHKIFIPIQFHYIKSLYNFNKTVNIYLTILYIYFKFHIFNFSRLK